MRSFDARESEPAIPVMLKVLEEMKPSKEPLGQAVAEALGQLAPGTQWEGRAVTALISALDAAWEYTRAEAARSLARFGPRASAAIPRLKAIAVRDPSPDARKAATDAIAAIEAAEVRPGSNGESSALDHTRSGPHPVKSRKAAGLDDQFPLDSDLEPATAVCLSFQSSRCLRAASRSSLSSTSQLASGPEDRARNARLAII
jgi:hypothetical protein